MAVLFITKRERPTFWRMRSVAYPLRGQIGQLTRQPFGEGKKEEEIAIHMPSHSMTTKIPRTAMIPRKQRGFRLKEDVRDGLPLKMTMPP